MNCIQIIKIEDLKTPCLIVYVIYLISRNCLIVRKCSINLLNNNCSCVFCLLYTGNRKIKGVQWLSGKVLDSRKRGREFEPHRHCVLEQEHLS